jgi:hypothetical protein
MADSTEVPLKRVTDRTLCPRCGTRLTDPDGLGWCPGCGYCRSLEEEGRAVVADAPEPAAPKKPSLLGHSEFGEAMRLMPGWAWPLLGGMAAIATICVLADYLLDEECLARALWSAIWIVLGVAGLISAQLWAVLMVGAGEDKIGAKDVIMPGRTWLAACRRLPATRKPVWLGAWSLTALICAVTVVGGFGYWMELLRTRQLRIMAENLANVSTAKETDREDKPAGAPSAPEEKKPATLCVVIGYQGDDTEVSALALASMKGNGLQFVGVVREGLSPAQRRALMSRLSKLTRPEPLIPGTGLKGMVWVKPGVFCDAVVTGKPGEGPAPTFQGLRD